MDGVHVTNYDNCSDRALAAFENEAVDFKSYLPVKEYEFDTHWTFVYRFNMIVYTMLSGMILCSFAGLIYSSLLQATLSCLQVAGVAHFAAIILSGVFRFNDNGTICSEKQNMLPYDKDGNTFAEDSTLLKNLYIAQLCLFLPFCACSCIGFWRHNSPEKQAALDKAMMEHTDDDYHKPTPM